MKNPLRKRLIRELRSEVGKYFVIFLLLMTTIGFVSGFLVADGSMITAYNESFTKYNIENGHFKTTNQMNKAQKKTIEEENVKIYDLSYVEEKLKNGSTLRIFPERTTINKVCLMQGKMPTKKNEIAIDRMYAVNNKIEVGDKIGSDTHSWTVTGLVALSDYSSLFANNNDSMFDSVKFGVAIVTKDFFDTYKEEELIYCYAWKYNEEPTTTKEEKEVSEDLMQVLNEEVSLEEYVPRYLNQAIKFTGEDMGSDKAMMVALLYIVIAIMAFVFSITTSNTIHKEANVIGTLRASGYTKKELIMHYMTMPMIVTLFSALVGNIIGYTVLKDVCAGMYYGSYSLPTFVTIWNGEAFLLTTVIPVILMAAINALVLAKTMKLSPLKFLRRDLTKKKQKYAFPLSSKIPFFTRFRLRVVFQNASNYIMLLIGILFANLLLIFGLVFPSILDHYQAEMEKNLLCNYQYMLQVPLSAMNENRKLESLLSMAYFQSQVETDNEDAEKFSAYSLKTLGDGIPSEEVLLYGLQDNSKYIKVDTTKTYISLAYAEKYGLKVGDKITLKEEYENDTYDFTVDGIYDYEGALAVFLGQERLNKIFDLGEDYFCGYLSNTKITDIDEKYISSVIDLDSLTKISRQLTVSMGGMMSLVNGFAIGIFLVLVYLLSKIIIEKNAQSISMAKILGYSNLEISKLYIISTSIMVVLFLLISYPIEYILILGIFKIVMVQMISGWIPFYVDPKIFVEMFVMGVASYAFVAILEYRKIQKVPMDEALKNVE